MASGGSWLERAVALLLVAVCLQAGSFRDLEDANDWYFGTPDYGAVTLTGARKALAIRAQADDALGNELSPDANDPSAFGAAPRRGPALDLIAFVSRGPLAGLVVSHPLPLRPDPTGPPRA